MKKHVLYFTLIALVATFSFAACGGNDDPTPTPPAAAGAIIGAIANECPSVTVDLTIGAINGATSFQWYKDGATITGATTTTYTVTATGSYTVSGVNADGEGVRSAAKMVTITVCATDPTNLTFTNITPTSANLAWEGTADSYEIMVGANTYTSTIASYNATNLTTQTNYAWKVRAKKGDTYSNWVNGASFTTTSLADGVFVVFGSVTWMANTSEVADVSALAGIPLLDFWAYKTTNQAFPILNFVSTPTGTTIYSTESTCYYEYYENDFLEDDEGTKYGDWWVQSGTLTITASANSKISGTACVVMFSAKQKYIDKNSNPETRTMAISFNNIAVSAASPIGNLEVKTTKTINLKPKNINFSTLKVMQK